MYVIYIQAYTRKHTMKYSCNWGGKKVSWMKMQIASKSFTAILAPSLQYNRHGYITYSQRHGMNFLMQFGSLHTVRGTQEETSWTLIWDNNPYNRTSQRLRVKAISLFQMRFTFLCTGFFTSEPPNLWTTSVSALLVSFMTLLHRDFKLACVRLRTVHTGAASGTVHNEATDGEQETGHLWNIPPA